MADRRVDVDLKINPLTGDANAMNKAFSITSKIAGAAFITSAGAALSKATIGTKTGQQMAEGIKQKAGSILQSKPVADALGLGKKLFQGSRTGQKFMFGRSIFDVLKGGAKGGVAGAAGGPMSAVMGAATGAAGGGKMATLAAATAPFAMKAMLPLAVKAVAMLGPMAIIGAAAVGIKMAVSFIAKAQKAILSMPAVAVAGGLKLISGMLREMAGPMGVFGVYLKGLGAIGEAMEKLGDRMGIFGVGLSVMGKSIRVMSEAVGEFATTMLSLAAKANPALMERWQMVLNDTQAVFGRLFIPVLKGMIKVGRGVADAFLYLLPSMRDVQQIVNMFRPMFAEVGAMFREMAPFLKAHGKTIMWFIKAIVLHIAVAAKIMMRTARIIATILNPMALARWVRGGGTPELPSSFGMAPRPAQFVGIEDLARQMQQSAYDIGIEGGSVPERQLTVLEQIRNILRGRSAEGLLPGEREDRRYVVREPLLAGERRDGRRYVRRDTPSGGPDWAGPLRAMFDEMGW